MFCKVFISSSGYLLQGIGQTPISLEDAINRFLNDTPVKVSQIVQSQSSYGVTYVSHNVTTIIFYENN